MSTVSLKILNLYPRELNIYGDVGNLLVLKKRAEWRNIAVEVVNFEPHDELALLEGVNLIVGGGGQDSGQLVAQADLMRSAPALKELIEADVPALLVCGSYQLFGNRIDTTEGDTILGAGILNLHTQNGSDRIVGNIVTESKDFGELIGYENHSGRTYLGAGLEPLAKVRSGFGNNGTDGGEGALYRNALGTYLHGPLLSKNPRVADFLIACALAQQTGDSANAVMEELTPLADTWVAQAREAAKARPR